MQLDDFLSAGWRDHGDDAQGVFDRLPAGLPLVTEPKHLPALAGLIVHVAGEHLGRWADGVRLLRDLQASPHFTAASPEGKSVLRSEAVLHHCAGDTAEEARCLAAGRSGGDVPEASDRVRVLAIAASAFLGQKRITEGAGDFDAALALARTYGPGAQDPAARSLAVTGNNLACELENRLELSAAERALMLRAASAGLEFWRIAGGWMEEERAEYRLAMAHIKAGDADTALEHARRCATIVEKNGSDAGEVFFAREAAARAHLAMRNLAAARAEREGMARALPGIADASFREYCAGEMSKLDAALDRG